MPLRSHEANYRKDDIYGPGNREDYFDSLRSQEELANSYADNSAQGLDPILQTQFAEAMDYGRGSMGANAAMSGSNPMAARGALYASQDMRQGGFNEMEALKAENARRAREMALRGAESRANQSMGWAGTNVGRQIAEEDIYQRDATRSVAAQGLEHGSNLRSAGTAAAVIAAGASVMSDKHSKTKIARLENENMRLRKETESIVKPRRGIKSTVSAPNVPSEALRALMERDRDMAQKHISEYADKHGYIPATEQMVSTSEAGYPRTAMQRFNATAGVRPGLHDLPVAYRGGVTPAQGQAFEDKARKEWEMSNAMESSQASMYQVSDKRAKQEVYDQGFADAVAKGVGYWNKGMRFFMGDTHKANPNGFQNVSDRNSKQKIAELEATVRQLSSLGAMDRGGPAVSTGVQAGPDKYYGTHGTPGPQSAYDSAGLGSGAVSTGVQAGPDGYYGTHGTEPIGADYASEDYDELAAETKPYEYEYKPEVIRRGIAPPGRQIGVMAQDVERGGQVGRDMVSTGPHGYKQIDVPQAAMAGMGMASNANRRSMMVEQKMKELEQSQAEINAKLGVGAVPTPAFGYKPPGY